MMLWAVFLAIFLPAALVAAACFRLAVAHGAGGIATLGTLAVAGDSVASSSWRGFIWMILRDRVGGGGRAKLSLAALLWAADERRRDLTVSLAWT